MVIPVAFPDSFQKIESDEYIQIDFRGLSIFSSVYFWQWSPDGPGHISGISEILGKLLFWACLFLAVSIFSRNDTWQFPK
jgi:hypothetical protein